jgi:hypothetical protein
MFAFGSDAAAYLSSASDAYSQSCSADRLENGVGMMILNLVRPICSVSNSRSAAHRRSDLFLCLSRRRIAPAARRSPLPVCNKRSVDADDV